MGVSEPVRLYVPGSVMGFKRGKTNQHNSCSLLKLDGVNTKEETDFYMGKRVAFIYKAKTLKQGTRFRCIWGKITRAHGAIGSVQAKFQKHLPSKALSQQEASGCAMLRGRISSNMVAVYRERESE